MSELERLAAVADACLRTTYKESNLRRSQHQVLDPSPESATSELIEYYLRPSTNGGWREEINVTGPHLHADEQIQYRRTWRIISDPRVIGQFSLCQLAVEESLTLDRRISSDSLRFTTEVRRGRLTAICHRGWPFYRFGLVITSQGQRHRDGPILAGDSEPAICMRTTDVQGSGTPPAN